MKRITQWKPDTHDCIIELEWDDAVPESERTHTVKRIVKSDPSHASKDVEQQFADILEENQRRNKVLGWIAENVASASEDYTDESGVVSKRIKRGVKVDCNFNKDDRCLEVTVEPSLGTIAKNLIQTFVDNRLGEGRVRFI